MAEKKNDNLLEVLGHTATILGPVIFGHDYPVDFGAPLKAAAARKRQQKEEQALSELLMGEPETAPFVKEGENIAANGGLLAMLNNQPTAPAPTGAQFDLNLPSLVEGEVGGVPNTPTGAIPTGGGLMDVMQNMQNPPQRSAPKQPVDINSTDFIGALANAGLGELAQKMLLTQAQKSPKQLDPLKQELLKLQIENFETPAQKQERALELTDARAENQRKLQEERDRLARAKFNASELKKLNEIDETFSRYLKLDAMVSSGQFQPSYFKNAVADYLPGGNRLLQAVDPQFTQLKSAATDAQAQYVKMISGVAVAKDEFTRLLPTQPQAGDDPEYFVELARQNQKKFTEMRLMTLDTLERQGRDVSNYISAQDLADYRIVRELLKKNPKRANDPDVKAVRDALGINYNIDMNTKLQKGLKVPDSVY